MPLKATPKDQWQGQQAAHHQQSAKHLTADLDAQPDPERQKQDWQRDKEEGGMPRQRIVDGPHHTKHQPEGRPEFQFTGGRMEAE